MPAYIGVNGKAKAIAKVYKGDSNGKAQLIWGPKGIVKYTGNIKDLSVARHHLSATTVGNYALFGGGSSATNTNEHVTYYSTVDAYNTSLTRTTATDLSEKKFYLAATTVGNYALFGGGCYDYDNRKYVSTVDAYNTSLTRTTATSLREKKYSLTATTVGDHALFGGGFGNTSRGGRNYLSTVDAYNTSLTRTTATSLSAARYRMSATTVGNYALFAGGVSRSNSTDSYYSTVDAYNTSLTRTTATDLSEKKFYLSATTVGNYALFGGGCIGTYSSTSTVDAYDSFLTRTTATSLNGVRDELGATTVGNYALFGGGLYRGHYDVRTVEVYDSSLTRTTATDLSHSRSSPEATTVGNYALFGGGRWSDTLSTVDAYYIWE